jgi:succinate dehydrogenase hydrophobic anchor subunit
MSTANWVFIVFIVVLIILIAIGLWFPRGKSDWPLSGRATVYLIIAALFFLLLVILINLVSQYVNWSGFISSSIYFTVTIFALLIVLSIFFPNGLRR